METADFNVDDFDDSKQKQGDDSLLVKFYLRSRPDSTASLREGRPMFRDVEYIDIKIPGTRSGGACRPVRQSDLDRFPKHYAAFKNRVEEPESGTPLIEWPLITRSQAEELAFFNVKTVEQLVEMADVHVSKFMGLNAMRDKAKIFLQKAADEAPELALQEAVATKDEEIRLLTERLNALENKGLPDNVEVVPLVSPVLDAAEPEDELGERSEEDNQDPPEPEKTVVKAPAKRKRRSRKKR